MLYPLQTNPPDSQDRHFSIPQCPENGVCLLWEHSRLFPSRPPNLSELVNSNIAICLGYGISPPGNLGSALSSL